MNEWQSFSTRNASFQKRADSIYYTAAIPSATNSCLTRVLSLSVRPTSAGLWRAQNMAVFHPLQLSSQIKYTFDVNSIRFFASLTSDSWHFQFLNTHFSGGINWAEKMESISIVVAGNDICFVCCIYLCLSPNVWQSTNCHKNPNSNQINEFLFRFTTFERMSYAFIHFW